MGGFFGVSSRREAVLDVFFGVDYHSHLGTKSAGMVVWSGEDGFKREIHSISNTPFRSKFESELSDLHGTSGIGCISDTDPQPILVRSHLGVYAIITTGIVNNAEELTDDYIRRHGGQFNTVSSGRVNTSDLIAALINEKENLVAGLRNVQELVDGSMTVLILDNEGNIIVARDRVGRLPVMIGRDADGCSVAFEAFAFRKLGYEDAYELGPGEIVKVTPDGWETLAPAGEKMKICAFLWSYYGFPSATYEGQNVESVRYKNGINMARFEKEHGGIPEVDYVAGVPDSGIGHAIGYAQESGKTYARPLTKYTPTWPRSFTPENQEIRNKVARMKLIPVKELIKGKKLLFIDDSIVRGTQLKGTLDFLYEAGAAEVHMRSACPPIMYACKYLNFSRSNSDMALIARRTINDLEGEEGQKHIDEYADSTTERGKCMLKTIADQMGFESLGFQSLDGLLDAIGLDRESICTYCWTGKE